MTLNLADSPKNEAVKIIMISASVLFRLWHFESYNLLHYYVCFYALSLNITSHTSVMNESEWLEQHGDDLYQVAVITVMYLRQRGFRFGYRMPRGADRLRLCKLRKSV